MKPDKRPPPGKRGIRRIVLPLCAVALVGGYFAVDRLTRPDVGPLLERVNELRVTLRDALVADRQRCERVLLSAPGVSPIANRRGPAPQEIADAVTDLKAAVAPYGDEINPNRLRSIEDLQFRLANGWIALAERRYADALTLVPAADAELTVRTPESIELREVAVNQLRGDALYGLERWQDALAPYARLVKVRPDPIGTLVDSAMCLARAGQMDQALRVYDGLVLKCTTLIEQEGREELRDVWAALYAHRGSARTLTRQIEDALGDFTRAVSILTTLYEYEGRYDVGYTLAGALDNRAAVFGMTGKREEALGDIERAIDIFTTLVDDSAGYPPWEDLARCYNSRGLLLATRGRLDDSIRDYTESVGIWSPLIEEQPTPYLRAGLAAVLSNRGFVYRFLRRLDDALQDYNEAVQVYEELLALRNRKELRIELAKTLTGRGLVLASRKDNPSAAADFQRAVDLYTALIEQEGHDELLSHLQKVRKSLEVIKRRMEADVGGES